MSRKDDLDALEVLLARYALIWLNAERSAQAGQIGSIAADARMDGRDQEADQIALEASGSPASPDEIARATDRVWQVLKGEVRWSEAGPGDRAVWRGRFRSIDQYERTMRALTAPDDAGTHASERADKEIHKIEASHARPPGNGPRLLGYRERLGYHYYDTRTLVGGEAHDGLHRFFTNENIGNFFRSNQMVGGFLPAEMPFVVMSWWVWVSSVDAMAWLANNALFTFIIGNKPMTPHTFARDLYMGVTLLPPWGRPLIIPVRQAYSVQMELKEFAPKRLGSFDVMVFFEGLQTRSVL